MRLVKGVSVHESRQKKGNTRTMNKTLCLRLLKTFSRNDTQLLSVEEKRLRQQQQQRRQQRQQQQLKRKKKNFPHSKTLERKKRKTY